MFSCTIRLRPASSKSAAFVKRGCSASTSSRMASSCTEGCLPCCGRRAELPRLGERPVASNVSDPAAIRSGNVRAAVVQAAPVLFDTPRTLQKLADLAADAARERAELVVFPEAFVGGYLKGHDFGVTLGIRSPE